MTDERLREGASIAEAVRRVSNREAFRFVHIDWTALGAALVQEWPRTPEPTLDVERLKDALAMREGLLSEVQSHAGQTRWGSLDCALCVLGRVAALIGELSQPTQEPS